MANGARLGAAVVFVHELDRSVSFYQDVLALEVTDSSSTATLLTSASGAQLVLRAIGTNASHPLGPIGVQYVIWTTDSRDELDRCAQALRIRSALLDSRGSDPATVLEGRDPDGMVVMIVYRGRDQAPLDKLYARIYDW